MQNLATAEQRLASLAEPQTAIVQGQLDRMLGEKITLQDSIRSIKVEGDSTMKIIADLKAQVTELEQKLVDEQAAHEKELADKVAFIHTLQKIGSLREQIASGIPQTTPGHASSGASRRSTPSSSNLPSGQAPSKTGSLLRIQTVDPTIEPSHAVVDCLVPM